MYAKVHKSELTLVGHAIGDKWKIATMESRKQDIMKLAEFSSTLNSNLSKETVHKKNLRLWQIMDYVSLASPE